MPVPLPAAAVSHHGILTEIAIDSFAGQARSRALNYAMSLASSSTFFWLRSVTSPSSSRSLHTPSRETAVASCSRWDKNKSQHWSLPEQDLSTAMQEMNNSQEELFLSSQAQSCSCQVVLPTGLLWMGTFLQGLLCSHCFLAHIWLVKSFISQGHKLPWQLLGKLSLFVFCSFPLCPLPLIKPAVLGFPKAETKRTPTLSNWDVAKLKSSHQACICHN